MLLQRSTYLKYLFYNSSNALKPEQHFCQGERSHISLSEVSQFPDGFNVVNPDPVLEGADEATLVLVEADLLQLTPGTRQAQTRRGHGDYLDVFKVAKNDSLSKLNKF